MWCSCTAVWEFKMIHCTFKTFLRLIEPIFCEKKRKGVAPSINYSRILKEVFPVLIPVLHGSKIALANDCHPGHSLPAQIVDSSGNLSSVLQVKRVSVKEWSLNHLQVQSCQSIIIGVWLMYFSNNSFLVWFKKERPGVTKETIPYKKADRLGAGKG